MGYSIVIDVKEGFKASDLGKGKSSQRSPQRVLPLRWDERPELLSLQDLGAL